MWFLNEKFLNGSDARIKDFLTDILCPKAVMMEDDQSVSIDDKISLSKSILKLIREISYDGDSRM